MNLVDVNEYLANVAQMVRKCPTVTLRHAYMRAYRQWCQETQWLRDTIPGVTVANVSLYNLGNDPNLDICGIYAMQGSITNGGAVQTFPLPPSDPGSWNPNFLGPNQPLRYAYMPEAQFALNPTPNTVYQLSITLILEPKEAAVNVPLSPLVKYSNTFEAGALAYLLALPGMPWSDPKSALVWDARFNSGISNGKAEVQRNFNTGAQRVRPRQFVIGNRA